MAELLLELFSEEIPARMQAIASENLESLFVSYLEKERLNFSSTRSFVTPRRLTLLVVGLETQQPDILLEKKGPRVDAPKAAIDGFLKSVSTSLNNCEIRETTKGKVLFYTKTQSGRATENVLLELIPNILRELPWQKSMRWGTGTQRWVRPLHSILCLFDSAIVPFQFAGLTASNVTKGHRYMSGEPFKVDGFDDYENKLFESKVILDPIKRKSIIQDKSEKLVSLHNLSLDLDQLLLLENVGLNEWPVPLIGRFDPLFLSIPEEVLVSAMRRHQKYFAVRDADGNLASRFILISNLVTADGGKEIISGNERVLRARLSDARFFWELDLKTNLEVFAKKLDNLVFHTKLGSVGDKTNRLATLSKGLSNFVADSNPNSVERAAKLCKADLVTEMVSEFPDLQGVMGAHYARAQEEMEEVSCAISDHYKPQGPNDICPTSPTSVVLALVDKIDTLVGFFGIDEKPTGSKDPFALRRAALGVIRLILENQLRIPLSRVISDAVSAYGDELLNQVSTKNLISSLLSFITERLKVYLREQGNRHDLITAVFATGFEDDLVRLLSRVDALESFLNSDDGANLLIAYRRAANILRIEEAKDGKTYTTAASKEDFIEVAEKRLMEQIVIMTGETKNALSKEDFSGAMISMASLRHPVDDFFDQVKVNDSNPLLRENRLRLLSNVRMAMDQFADFSLVKG